MSAKPVHALLLLAIATPLLALLPQSPQDPARQDWNAAVAKACTSRRFGLRLAAARKIASAGGAAIPAIRAWAAENGDNALPSTLVEAIAKAKTTDAPVVDQLLSWARDRTFYWRTYAMLGIATRAPNLPERRDELAELFGAYRDDPAWLVATHARLGLHLLGTGDRSSRNGDDPRLAGRLCALRLTHGQVPPLQPLLDALADERTFLGVPWGRFRARYAHRALRAALGELHPMADGAEGGDKIAKIRAVRDAIAAKWGQDLVVPELKRDPDVPFTGGIEVQSCRNGDFHLRWTADGRLYAGLEGRLVARVPADRWEELSRELASLRLDGNHGVVICDNMRLKWDRPETHVKVAPGALPDPAAKWLGKLATVLQDADKPLLATALRRALVQFAAS